MKERAPFYGYDEAEQRQLCSALAAASTLIDMIQGLVDYFAIETTRHDGFDKDRDEINEALAMVARKRSQ